MGSMMVMFPRALMFLFLAFPMGIPSPVPRIWVLRADFLNCFALMRFDTHVYLARQKTRTRDCFYSLRWLDCTRAFISS